MPCNCAEGRFTRVNGAGETEIVAAPPVHDCAYIRARNALIPEALVLAPLRLPAGSGGYRRRWMQAFHAAMTELAARAFRPPRRIRLTKAGGISEHRAGQSLRLRPARDRTDPLNNQTRKERRNETDRAAHPPVVPRLLPEPG